LKTLQNIQQYSEHQPLQVSILTAVKFMEIRHISQTQ